LCREVENLPASKPLVWAEAAVALLAGEVGILTITWPDWIEALIGWNPDRYNGSVEWLISLIALALAITMGVAARWQWHRLVVSGT
jgi:hypothetical protein